jgi:hypothetical protein
MQALVTRSKISVGEICKLRCGRGSTGIRGNGKEEEELTPAACGEASHQGTDHSTTLAYIIITARISHPYPKIVVVFWKSLAARPGSANQQQTFQNPTQPTSPLSVDIITREHGTQRATQRRSLRRLLQ